MNWKLELKVPESKMTKSWLKVWSNIIQSLELSNMRGDDVTNINQIVLNMMNDEDKTYHNDVRQTGYMWMTRIIDNEYVEVVNDIDGCLVVYFEIINNKNK